MIIIASLLQIMDYVGSLDSSRDLQLIHTKSFVNRLHLVLHNIRCDIFLFTEFMGCDLNRVKSEILFYLIFFKSRITKTRGID